MSLLQPLSRLEMTNDVHLIPVALHWGSSNAIIFFAATPSGIDTTRRFIFIFLFCCKTQSASSRRLSSGVNRPGGIFDFTVHYIQGTVSCFK